MASFRSRGNLQALFTRLVLGALAPLAPACNGNAQSAQPDDASSSTCGPTLVASDCSGATAKFPCAVATGQLSADVCALLCGSDPETADGCSLLSPVTAGATTNVACDRICCPPPDVTVTVVPDAATFDDEAGTFDESLACAAICTFPGDACSLDAGPPLSIACSVAAPCGGRRPAGLSLPRSYATPLGAYFASLAQLEAASVPAFRRMARELSRFGAPRRLVKAAERAAREERRHARGAVAFARRLGAGRASFETDARGERSLEEFAIENAVEGCVRETYGALVATWQAHAASDPHVRAHMTRIAREETTHAELAWRTHGWAGARLGAAARARVEAARFRASRELVNEVSSAMVPAEVAKAGGVPPATVAREFAESLATTLC